MIKKQQSLVGYFVIINEHDYARHGRIVGEIDHTYIIKFDQLEASLPSPPQELWTLYQLSGVCHDCQTKFVDLFDTRAAMSAWLDWINTSSETLVDIDSDNVVPRKKFLH